MKFITSVVALLVFAVSAVTPASAQDVATITFRLTVQGAPCPNVTYWANFGLAATEDVHYAQLMDPEGDGVYTVSTNVPTGRDYYFYLWEGTGSVRTTTPTGQVIDAPGEPRRIIKDFSGTTQTGVGMTVTEDMVFEASVEGCPAPPDGGTTPGDSQVSLQFRLTVQGAPCPDATYWGLIGVPQSEGFGVQLTDPDGDRIYTGSTSWGVGNPLFIRLVQGTGTQQVPPVPGPLPGEPSVTIKDFGLVPITGDMVFEGSVAGCPAGLPDTGESDTLPVVPIAGGILVLAAGIYLRRRLLQHGSY